jgi:hypothetical protein
VKLEDLAGPTLAHVPKGDRGGQLPLGWAHLVRAEASPGVQAATRPHFDGNGTLSERGRSSRVGDFPDAAGTHAADAYVCEPGARSAAGFSPKPTALPAPGSC